MLGKASTNGGASIISCDGATVHAHFTNGTGSFNITVNDQFFQNSNRWGVGYMFLKTPELNNIIVGDGDGYFYCTNKSKNFLRVKLEPLDGEIWGIEQSNINNPTIDIDNNGVIQFCLAPTNEPSSDRHIISCTPQEGQQEIILNKVRDTLPFMTFANIPFNIYVNGSLVASNITLFDANNLLELGLKVTDLTGSGRKISILNNSPEQRAYELQPDISHFAADTDIELGLVEVYERSFHMCLAPAVEEKRYGAAPTFFTSK